MDDRTIKTKTSTNNIETDCREMFIWSFWRWVVYYGMVVCSVVQCSEWWHDFATKKNKKENNKREGKST